MEKPISRDAAQKIIEQNKRRIVKNSNYDILRKDYEGLDEISLEWLLKLKEKEDVIEMRKKWSTEIKRWLKIIITFDFIIIVFTGLGWLNFPEYVGIPAIVADSILKVVGLAYIVVRFLFSKDSLK